MYMMILDIINLYLQTQMEMQNINWHERMNEGKFLLGKMSGSTHGPIGTGYCLSKSRHKASFRCAKLDGELRLIPPNTGLNCQSPFSRVSMLELSASRHFIVNYFHNDLRPFAQYPSTNFKTSVAISPSYEIEISYI